MMPIMPFISLCRLVACLVSCILLSSLVDARRLNDARPGWSKFRTAIKHQKTASKSWPTMSDDAHLIAASRKNKVVEITPDGPREANVVEKFLIGSVIVAGTTAMEYASGFMGAFVLGTLRGMPGLVYSKEGLTMGQRFSNMNARSMRWGKTWAPISAVFGGSDAATRIIRNNKNDQWNTIISSAVAGAYFSRAGNVIDVCCSAVF